MTRTATTTRLRSTVTPHHLHAVAAAWSLQAARGRLADLAREEHRQAADELLAASTALRSPTYGTRHAVGGHGDPTGVGAGTPEPTITTWRDLLHRLDGRLDWLAGQIGAADGIFDAIECIRDRIPTLPAGTVRLVAAHLADEDQWVRAAVRLVPAREPLDGPTPPTCPACRCRSTLHVQTAGPASAWTVVCVGSRPPGQHAKPCLCTGQGCPCGMEGAVEGVAHIWPRAHVLGAVGGAR